MKEGILYYDEASGRMDIQFHSGGKYGGLHCGDCFDVWVDNKWTPTRIVILSRLVDTFISRISLTMLPVPKPHNTACVLSWEEARRWQSRSSGYSSS